MMRLPHFRHLKPPGVAEAARMLAGEGPRAMLIAGGTDLLPNMKRRQQVPETLISLREVGELRRIENGAGLRLGAGLTLTELVYDQAEEWRRAIGYCMKKDGETCWVATSSPRCLAVSSTDTAPALVALGARIRLVSAEGERTLELDELYRNDGIDYSTRRADEILTEVLLRPADGWRSTYWKLRRRGSFDFPVLSVAAAARLSAGGEIEECRIVLGAVASRPLLVEEAGARLTGRPPTDAAIAEAAALAAKPAKPMDNTDFTLHWRKRVASEFVSYALRELRGDDMRAVRERVARHTLESACF
jgi:4-hydroxybenzoyl-CoA reductase subunit beta